MAKTKVMVNVVGVKRHDDKNLEKGTFASFGFNVILAQKEATPEFEDGKFVWINALVGTERGSKVIEAYEAMANTLEPEDKKAIYSELTYHVNDKGYVVIDTLYRRDKKAA